MSRSIKELSVHYDPINESNTFTSGDIVEGRVVLEVTKEIKVDSFFVKLTGDAHVSWTEGSGDDERTYSDHERYFKLKQYFIQESSKRGESEKNTTLVSGENCETIRVFVDIDNSSSRDVKLKYSLKQQQTFIAGSSTNRGYKDIVKETRDRIPSGQKSQFTVDLTLPRDLTVTIENCRIIKVQYELKVYLDVSFASDLEVILPVVILPPVQQCPPWQGPTGGFQPYPPSQPYLVPYPGETIRVFVDIDNSSSRDVKLKYSLKQQQTFIAGSSTNRGYKDIVKETRDRIPSGQKSQFTVDLTLPRDLTVTIENCRIIKVQYELKVYLDVSFASDLEVILPVVILPPVQQCPPWQGPPGGFQPYPPSQPYLVPYPGQREKYTTIVNGLAYPAVRFSVVILSPELQCPPGGSLAYPPPQPNLVPYPGELPHPLAGLYSNL
ncbi:arrestin domain-containing 3-like protein [Labeo rohita]|uniref:Arrestin domain-containing 3-like protein n=1 Tax=Labeo rohita TaxID=84645 RepID=A0A498MJG9_LABRO|nr:arrestin domain-containing 3-like protein [Labeo rohita]